MRPSWPSVYSRFFSRAWYEIVKRKTGGSAGSSLTATTRSASSVRWKRPSLWISCGWIALLISAGMALNDPAADSAQKSATPNMLHERGWTELDSVGCSALGTNRFYAVESDVSTTEIFVVGNDRILAAGALPEPPYDCLPLSGPTFIEEIK